MNDFSLDNKFNNGSDRDVSIDDILAEFIADQSALYTYAQPDAAGAVSPAQSPQEPDDDVRVYVPGNAVSPAPAPVYEPPKSNIGSIEEEARRYIAQMQSRSPQSAARSVQEPEQYSDEAAEAPDETVADGDYGQEIDSRFNLGGQYDKRKIFFGDKSVDVGAASDYKPTRQMSDSISHWTFEPDGSPDDSDDGSMRRKKSKKKKKLAEKAAAAARVKAEPEDDDYYGFEDDEAAPAEYAENRAYEDKRKYDREDAGYYPPTFREYVSSLVASVFLRVRGNASGAVNSTMNDTEEDLGAEVQPAAASKYYGSFVKSQRLRLRISAGLLVLLCYISLGLPVPGMLKHIPVSAAACCAIQFAVMLVSLDIVTTGIMNLFRLKLGADSLAVISCLFTTADALIVALSDSAAMHMPLCVLSTLSLVGVTLASSLNTRALRKSIRVPAIGRSFYSVTGEVKFKGKQLALLKSLRSAKGFVRRSEEAPADETLFIKLGPVFIVLALLLTVVLSAVKHNYSDFLYIFSAMLAPAVPVCALCCYALPYFIGSIRIFKVGAAIAGWSGICDLGMSRSLIITDRDLFPESSVSLEGIRIFADESSEKVIAYAGTMICASGSCVTGCFSKLMEENNCTMKQVDAYQYLPGGGMSGLIDGHNVLCGSTDLMRLMNVRIPFRLTDKTSVLLAIDGILYGIFTVKYTPLPQVRRALVELVRSTRHPVFAIRDFNITPEMLHNTYDLATDGYDFPPYVERFELSESSGKKGGKIAAVICSEGLSPLTEVANVGHSMYVATRLNLLISVLSAFLGMFFVFIKLLTVGSVSVSYLFLFMAVWAVPVLIVSIFIMIKP